MGAITDITSLKAQIAVLEQKREAEKDAVTDEAKAFLVSLKPVNLLKGLFRSVNESPDLKSDILHGLVGLGTGFLTNKLLLGKMHGPLKKVLGMLLQVGITKAAVTYPETIKNKGLTLLANVLHSMKIKTPKYVVEQEHAQAGAIL
ncbi:MAG: hypothetical protein EOO48_04480 [Flavobacterium sp.]|nr:MAG: hypothetical protein EOO48_04480 [Flavobacterium sp.]